MKTGDSMGRWGRTKRGQVLSILQRRGRGQNGYNHTPCVTTLLASGKTLCQNKENYVSLWLPFFSLALHLPILSLGSSGAIVWTLLNELFNKTLLSFSLLINHLYSMENRKHFVMVSQCSSKCEIEASSLLPYDQAAIIFSELLKPQQEI